jgi:hypothetical protein
VRGIFSPPPFLKGGKWDLPRNFQKALLPLEKGSGEKIKSRQAKASFVAPSPGILRPPKFLLPDFFHGFRRKCHLRISSK